MPESKPPQHVAIIMDGNGRWAKRRGLARSEGHRAGAEAARRITRVAGNMGIPNLTLYALSTENLERPPDELKALSGLLRHYLQNEVEVLVENRIRLRVIGDRSLLARDLVRLVETAEAATAPRCLMTLRMAVCYGGRDEIVRAARRLAAAGDRITERSLGRALDTGGAPDPDLLIRTGGDNRLSNFLLWQLAYSEFYFSRVLWPDFSGKHLRAAIEQFRKRERRFGRTDDTVPHEAPPAPRGRRTFK